MSSLWLGCVGREHSTRVTVRTDAPPALFDRISIEIREDGSSQPCDGCRRDLAASELASGASFSIVAGARAPVLHLTLFRERGKPARRQSSIEVYATYADAAAESVEIRLGWSTVGTVQGSWEAPVRTDALPALAPQPPADCARQPEQEEVCVPGGSFWLGDPLLDLGGGIDREGNDERLVVLSPFLIDRREVSVLELRASGTELLPGCPTFADRDAAACVRWSAADLYCRGLGKRLPTEAELEYLMGGLRSTKFVWGDAMPECADAIVDDGRCNHRAAAPPGSAARDQLRVGERSVLDLVGNVAEWTADVWNSTNEACFAAPVLRDPRCELASPSLPDHRVIKGGAWKLDSFYLGAAMRAWVPERGASDPALGFRCARNGLP